MRRECRERFPPPPISKETASKRSRHASRHVRDARAVMHVGIAYLQWRGKRSRHSLRMRTRNFAYLARGPWWCSLLMHVHISICLNTLPAKPWPSVNIGPHACGYDCCIFNVYLMYISYWICQIIPFIDYKPLDNCLYDEVQYYAISYIQSHYFKYSKISNLDVFSIWK